ncbi:MAG: D-alanine--D-alanine ligase [Actinobacteria bacterium]|nr:D-alanine--D-alanine ligase [Actinomycetota bacterium]
MSKKIRVCLLFGGKSGEHEVSLQSAKSVYKALDKKKYNVFLVGIDKTGKWLLGNASNYLLNSSNPKLIKLNKANMEAITPVSKENTTQLISLNSVDSKKEIAMIDVFFPVTHGTFGEDGCLQGLLEFTNAAYVGAGVLGSSVGMDKDVMKRLLKEAGLPIADFFTIKKSDYSSKSIKNITSKFNPSTPLRTRFPVFVKPANMGSSVGINKANNIQQLKKAIKDAFLYDTKILIEENVDGREIECAVLGNDDPKASLPGEVMPSKKHSFYSYAAKYIDEKGANLLIPAKLNLNQVKKIQGLAIKTFKVLECSGMARVDFFLKNNGTVFINEINTLPGFTKISMYPKLWEATGVPYQKLLDKLIELAIEKKKQKDNLKRSFEI